MKLWTHFYWWVINSCLKCILKQPAFTYSACGTFTRNKERMEKFMQTQNTDFIYKSDLDKACFQNDMAYGKSKDLAKWTQSDKVLRDEAFKIVIDPKYDDCQRGLASMVYMFLIKILVEVWCCCYRTKLSACKWTS